MAEMPVFSPPTRGDPVMKAIEAGIITFSPPAPGVIPLPHTAPT